MAAVATEVDKQSKLKEIDADGHTVKAKGAYFAQQNLKNSPMRGTAKSVFSGLETNLHEVRSTCE
jgi:hypothetical protein